MVSVLSSPLDAIRQTHFETHRSMYRPAMSQLNRSHGMEAQPDVLGLCSDHVGASSLGVQWALRSAGTCQPRPDPCGHRGVDFTEEPAHTRTDACLRGLRQCSVLVLTQRRGVPMRHARLAQSLTPPLVSDRAICTRCLMRRQRLTRLAPLPLGRDIARISAVV
jgi:hypothetical protein